MRERLSLSTLGYFTFIYAGNVMLKNFRRLSSCLRTLHVTATTLDNYFEG